MKHKKRLMIFFMCISFFLTHRMVAQSTIGSEFLVGFMENNQKPNLPDKAVVVITANENVTGTIQFMGQQETFSLAKGQLYKKEFLSGTQDLIHRTSEIIENKSVRISTSGEVAVYAYNTRQNSADATVIYPVPVLGKEYFVTAHFRPLSDGPDNSESTLLVVANEDNTQVEITPSVLTEMGKPGKVPFTVTLNSGQSYQIKALGDLTGTKIKVLNSIGEDCKNLAVFGGSKMTTVGDCGDTGDHLFNQSLPLEYWGTNYIHIPLKNRTSGEVVKILASQDNTQITVNGVNKGSINAGEFMKLEFGRDEFANIQTSYPSSVSLLSKSQDCNTNPGLIGDPFLMGYQPNDLRVKSMDFYSLDESGFIFNNANILAPTASIGQIRLNGFALTSQFKPVPGNPAFSYAQVDLLDGKNSFESQEGAIIYVYGAGQRSSYGYSAGFTSSPVIAEVKNDHFTSDQEKWQVCINEESQWSLEFEGNLFTQFTWDFGDGTAPKAGATVSHIFTKEGQFTVKVEAKSGEGTCAIVHQEEFLVVVEKPIAELAGPISVCEGTEATYYLSNGTSNLLFGDYEIQGGQLLTQTESSLTIKWLEGITQGTIKAIPMSISGCMGEVVELVVEIGQGTSFAQPTGPAEFCGNENLIYEASQEVSGLAIEWIVIGGKIESGQGTQSVEVSWDLEASEWSLSYQLSGTQESTCSSISDKLVVNPKQSGGLEEAKIEGELEVCPGIAYYYILASPVATDQMQWLEVVGGSIVSESSSSIQIVWNLEEEEHKLRGLPISESGCMGEEIVLEIQVSQANLLPMPVGPTTHCGDESMIVTYEAPQEVISAEWIWTIIGGEIISGQGSSKIEVKWGMEGSTKEISYVVPSGNGACAKSSETLEIVSYDPILISVAESRSPECAGETNGKIALEISGGTGEYEFFWSHDPSVKGPIAENLPAGNYTIQVQDVSSCGRSTFEFLLEESDPLKLTGEIVQASIPCQGENNGIIRTKITGGIPPYQVDGLTTSWDGEFLEIGGLAAGPYTLAIFDSKGCSVSLQGQIGEIAPMVLAFVEESPRCPGDFSGRLEVKVSGGVPPYSYAWGGDGGVAIANTYVKSSPIQGPLMANLTAGVYEISVTDAAGCRVVGMARVIESKPLVRMPTGFIPQDGPFEPVSNCPVDFDLSVFDRWGNLIYQGSEGWDGLVNGKEVPTGSYGYRLTYYYQMGGEEKLEEIQSAVTLIR